MNQNNKNNIRTFTPEELGLKRITVDGRTYLDVTPFWIDSKESQRIQKYIEEHSQIPENYEKEEKA